MPSDIVLNPGAAGATLRTDLLGTGQQVQYAKLMDGTAAGTNVVIVTAAGALKVDNSAVNQPVIGPGASGAALSGNPVRVAGAFNTTQPTVTNGQTVDLQATARGGLIVSTGVDTFTVSAVQSGTWNIGTVTTLTTLSTITNVVHVDDNAGSLTVDNGGTFAVQATIAAGATAIAKAEDVASADADVGVPALAVRKATPANTSGTDGDYEFLQMSAGRLWVDASGVTLTVSGTITTTPPSNASTNVAQFGGTNVATGTGAGGSGIPRVTISNDSTLAANQSVNIAQLAGNTISSGVGATGTGTLRTVVANDAGRTLTSTGGSASSSGNNTLVAAGTNRLKVYAFSLSTTSATAVTCIFQSGAGGTELWRVILQAPTSVSTGANLVVQPPAWLFATASATLLNLNLSGAIAVHWSVSYWDEA